MLELSDAENFYIIDGINECTRIDGRDNEDYRPISLEIGNITNSNGSSRLRLGDTEVVVAVKSEIQKPTNLDKGNIEFILNCSANASPILPGKGAVDFGEEIIAYISAIYNSGQQFDYKKLIILENEYQWKLFIEILILEYGGNIYDIVALAVKAALYNTKLPLVKITLDEDYEKPLIELSNNPKDEICLDVENIPCLVTVSKVGSSHIVDATMEEESCVIASLIYAVSPGGKILGTKKVGGGSLNPMSMQDMIKTATNTGTQLNQALMKTLLNIDGRS